MNSSRKKTLIIGCGVAGPVVALFLQRAGIEAEIYEARAESTNYGGSFLNHGVQWARRAQAARA